MILESKQGLFPIKRRTLATKLRASIAFTHFSMIRDMVATDTPKLLTITIQPEFHKYSYVLLKWPVIGDSYTR